MLFLPSKLDSDSRLAKHFLPHQIAWIQAEKAIHKQRKQAVALAEKSVRIGWTYTDAFKNVRKRLHHKTPPVLLRPIASAKQRAMQNPERPDIHSESFLKILMRRQLRLSILCAAAFLIGVLGLPLVNYFFPDFMAVRVFGFTLTWLILGIGFFPVVWLIAWLFIRRSIALEQAEVAEACGAVSSGKVDGKVSE